MSNSNNDAWSAGTITLAVGLALVAIYIVAALIAGSMTPWYYNVQRQAVQNSQQYVEGNRSTLLDQQGSYDRLETQKHQFADDSQSAKDLTTQQKQLLIQMHDEADKIPADAVPPSVKTFLDAHPKP